MGETKDGGLRSKEMRALKALAAGEQLNTSLLYAAFRLADGTHADLINIDASNGLDDIAISITEAGRTFLAARGGQHEPS